MSGKKYSIILLLLLLLLFLLLLFLLLLLLIFFIIIMMSNCIETADNRLSGRDSAMIGKKGRWHFSAAEEEAGASSSSSRRGFCKQQQQQQRPGSLPGNPVGRAAARPPNQSWQKLRLGQKATFGKWTRRLGLARHEARRAGERVRWQRCSAS